MTPRFRIHRYLVALVFGAVLLVAPLGAGMTHAADPPPGANAPAHRFFKPRVATPPRAVGMPTRLRIPKIRVNAPVERVGKDKTGAMDVPKDYDNTGWYELGPRPGERGNAVVAGHVDSTTGLAVFWELRLLKTGDEIFVVGDDNRERRFVVTASVRYRYEEVPVGRIFGAASGTHLNLITCDAQSDFDETRLEYAGTLVVYADMVP